ncbi:MAG: 2-amino-4-hydroxy-6-hydroxymethyldihydropteridine diphosphokinase [Maricaulaceae bacterium]|nr:2-amino-4-hydroxy-6-hydroxymethyldihydropteridine diphosphokinase [Maricaulaceae bacterium]
MGVIIALGGNLPFKGRPPEQTIPLALDRLQALGVRVAARSRLWRTPAWPDPAGPAYVNAAARVETDLQPAALLALLHRVEDEFGRDRNAAGRWGARTLDIDLIDHDGCVQPGGAGNPVLPHPRAHLRAFVLLPLHDVAPDWIHPGNGETVDALIAALPPADLVSAQPFSLAAESGRD